MNILSREQQIAVLSALTEGLGIPHLNVTEASRRDSPAAVVAVERVALAGEPEQISTSYVERQPHAANGVETVCAAQQRAFQSGWNATWRQSPYTSHSTISARA